MIWGIERNFKRVSNGLFELDRIRASEVDERLVTEKSMLIVLWTVTTPEVRSIERGSILLLMFNS